MQRRNQRTWAVVAALALAGCSTGPGTPPAADDGGAWMDGADVRVERDLEAGRERVTLVDRASGFAQVMDEEALVDADEWDEPPGPEVRAPAPAASPAK